MIPVAWVGPVSEDKKGGVWERQKPFVSSKENAGKVKRPTCVWLCVQRGGDTMFTSGDKSCF